MNIKDYIIRYQAHTDGEDSIYRHVEWTSTYLCPVRDLVPDAVVPFTPDKSLSEPSIKCKSVSETEVVLEYDGYTGDGRGGLQTTEIVLNERHKSWSCFFGGGRYDTDRTIELVKQEDL